MDVLETYRGCKITQNKRGVIHVWRPNGEYIAFFAENLAEAKWFIDSGRCVDDPYARFRKEK